MKRLCVIVLAAAAFAATTAPAARAQQTVTIPTCVGMESLYPAPMCGKLALPFCNWDGMKTCKLSRKRWQPTRYSSRCIAWHCRDIAPW